MKLLTLICVLSFCSIEACALIKSFDYVIVGGGTSGLVIANRLSEDPSITVAIIEAGTDQRMNPNVTFPENYSKAFGTSIDWGYMTTSQPGVENQILHLNQGKAWGGTSTINGMTYIRGDTAEFDAWEQLGNKGWNWKTLFPYYKKSEMYTIPRTTQLDAGATYESKYHGFHGHVHVGYIPGLVNGSFAPKVIQAWESLSLPHNPDLNSGNVRGFSMGPQTLDPALDTRWDSARAYYYSVENRSNLKIIKGTVKRLTWAEKCYRPRCNGLVATGVEFLSDGGVEFLKATNEVIISAGAVRTPLVLESSGIGNPIRLGALGIKTQIDLPGVGENLIDQPGLILAYSGHLDSSLSAYHTFVTMADLFGSDVATVAEATRANLSIWAKETVEVSGGALKVKAVEKLLQVQHDLLFKENVTAAEIITVIAPGGLLASNFWILLPFSRGSVHLGSADRINEPVINPRILQVGFDLNATIASGKFAQSFWLSEPMKDVVTAPRIPGSNVLPNNATDQQWESYVRGFTKLNSRPLGSAAMMSRELGGVVDPELRVYGTANVRVVDASILPTQISGHLTATLYAIAERASEIIKKGRW